MPPDQEPVAGPVAPRHGTVGGVRAITYTQTGDPDVLTLVDRPLAEPGPGEVRVRIHRSGVNPTDWKSRRGAGPGTPVDPAQVPNQDGSGVVDAVGGGVEGALLGLRVWVFEAAYQRPEGTITRCRVRAVGIRIKAGSASGANSTNQIPSGY